MGKRGRTLIGVIAPEQQRAATGLIDITTEFARNAAEEAEDAPAIIVAIDIDGMRSRNAARREVHIAEEQEVAVIRVTAHRDIRNQINLILQHHLIIRPGDAEGAVDGGTRHFIDGNLAGTEGEIVGDVDVRSWVNHRPAAVVITVRQVDTVIPGTRAQVTVDHHHRRRAVFGHVGPVHDAIGASQDVFIRIAPEPERVLIATKTDAINPIGAGTEGRGEIHARLGEITRSAAAAGTEPKLAATGRGFEGADIQGVILITRGDADATKVATGRAEVDLTHRGRRRDQADEFRLGDIVGQQQAGEAEAIRLGGDLLVSDIGGGKDAERGARIQHDIAHAERRTRARQALDKAGGGIDIARIHIDADLAGRAEGVIRVREFDAAVTELGELAARDGTREDRASAVIEDRVDDVVARAEGGRAGEVKITAGGQGEGRARSEIAEDHATKDGRLICRTASAVASVDARVAGEVDIACDDRGDLDAGGLDGIEARRSGDVATRGQGRPLHVDVLTVRDRVDRGTGAGERIDQAERAVVHDNRTGDRVAPLQGEHAITKLEETQGVNAGIQDSRHTVRDENIRLAGAGRAEIHAHTRRTSRRGERRVDAQDRIDRDVAVPNQTAGSDRDVITGDVRGDVIIRPERIDARVIGRRDAIGGRHVDDRGIDGRASAPSTARRHADAVFHLTDANGATDAAQGLEADVVEVADAEAGRVVRDIRIGGRIHNPHGGDPGVNDAGTVRGRAAQRDGIRRDQAIVGRRLGARGHTPRVRAVTIQDQAAVGGAREVTDIQGAATRIGMRDRDTTALGNRDVADGLGGEHRLRTVVAEGTAIEVDARGIGPAPLPARDLTPHFIDDDIASGTEDVVGGIRARSVVEIGSRAVVTPRIRAQLQRAEDFDGARTERRRATRGRAHVERHGHALVNRSTTGVVIRITEDDGVLRTRLGTAEPVIALEADADLGRASEDIIRTAENQGGSRTTREAVGITRADAERRGDVIDVGVQQALQDGVAITDGTEIQRRTEIGTSEREGEAVSAPEITGGEDGRREIAIEHDGAQRVVFAERDE